MPRTTADDAAGASRVRRRRGRAGARAPFKTQSSACASCGGVLAADRFGDRPVGGTRCAVCLDDAAFGQQRTDVRPASAWAGGTGGPGAGDGSSYEYTELALADDGKWRWVTKTAHCGPAAVAPAAPPPAPAAAAAPPTVTAPAPAAPPPPPPPPDHASTAPASLSLALPADATPAPPSPSAAAAAAAAKRRKRDEVLHRLHAQAKSRRRALAAAAEASAAGQRAPGHAAWTSGGGGGGGTFGRGTRDAPTGLLLEPDVGRGRAVMTGYDERWWTGMAPQERARRRQRMWLEAVQAGLYAAYLSHFTAERRDRHARQRRLLAVMAACSYASWLGGFAMAQMRAAAAADGDGDGYDDGGAPPTPVSAVVTRTPASALPSPSPSAGSPEGLGLRDAYEWWRAGPAGASAGDTFEARFFASSLRAGGRAIFGHHWAAGSEAASWRWLRPGAVCELLQKDGGRSAPAPATVVSYRETARLLVRPVYSPVERRALGGSGTVRVAAADARPLPRSRVAVVARGAAAVRQGVVAVVPGGGGADEDGKTIVELLGAGARKVVRVGPARLRPHVGARVALPASVAASRVGVVVGVTVARRATVACGGDGAEEDVDPNRLRPVPVAGDAAAAWDGADPAHARLVADADRRAAERAADRAASAPAATTATAPFLDTTAVTSIAPQIERTWRRGVVKKARRDGSLIVQVQLREGERPGPGDREVGGHAELGGLVVLRKCTLGQVVLDKTGAVGRMEPLCLVVDRRDPGARGRA